MDRKSKTEILPSSVSEIWVSHQGSGVTGASNQPQTASGARPPPPRATRSMTCLDLTMQCAVFQDSKQSSGNGPHGSSTSSTALLNLNQRMNQMKAQKELTSVQMYSQRMVRLRMTQNQRRQILPWFASTVVVPQGLG